MKIIINLSKEEIVKILKDHVRKLGYVGDDCAVELASHSSVYEVSVEVTQGTWPKKDKKGAKK